MAIMSLVCLLIVIVLAAFMKRNVGLLGLIFAFICAAIYGEGTSFFSGFPTNIVMILIGTGYLFGIANDNGTMENLAKLFLRLIKGRVALMPFAFGILGLVLTAIGASSFTMCLLILPIAMTIAEEKNISPLMMAIIVTCLTIAGDYSPIASFGLFIEEYFLTEAGVSGIAGHVFATTIVTYLLVCVVVYILLGGLKLWKQGSVATAEGSLDTAEKITFDSKQKMTLGGVLAFVVLVLVFPNLHTGLLALSIGVVLSILGCADEDEVIKRLPWGVILLISGVTLLVTLVRSSGGMDILINAAAKIASPGTITIVIGVIACFVAAFTSNMGIVFPTFMPMILPLIAEVGGFDMAQLPYLLTTFAVATCLPDVSPISTMGAIALSSASAGVDKDKLFRQMLTFAAIMIVVAPFITLAVAKIIPLF